MGTIGTGSGSGGTGTIGGTFIAGPGQNNVINPLLIKPKGARHQRGNSDGI